MFLRNALAKLFGYTVPTVAETDSSTHPRVQYIDLIDTSSTKPFITFTHDNPTKPDFDLVETTSELLEYEIKIDTKGNVYYKYPKVNKWLLQKDVKHIELRIID